MSLLTTSAASIHQLGAAAAFAGPPNSSSGDVLPSEGDGSPVVRSLWSRYEIIANVVMSVGWLVEQHTLRTTHDLDAETNRRVSLKDICVAGAMLTNLASIVVDQLFKRECPEGVRLEPSGALPAGTPARAKALWRCFNALKLVNRGFVGGAIGFTPLVNFGVLKSYRPGTIYRLFT